MRYNYIGGFLMKYTKLFLIVAVAIFALTISSCEELLSSLFGVSIEDRISAFQDTLNTADQQDILIAADIFLAHKLD